MEPSKPRSLGEMLISGATGDLAAQARARREVTEDIRALLSPDEAAELVGAHWQADGSLVLSMRSAVWAARVRFRHQALGADKLIVRIAPQGAPQGTPHGAQR